MFLRLIILALVSLVGFVTWSELSRQATLFRLANLARDKPVVGTLRTIYESARKGPLHATITDVKFDCATAQAFRREKEEIRSNAQPQGFLVTSPERSIFVVVTRDHERSCGKAGATVLSGIAMPVRSHVRRDFGAGLPKESIELMLEAGGDFWVRLIGTVVMGVVFLFVLVRGLGMLVSGG